MGALRCAWRRRTLRHTPDNVLAHSLRRGDPILRSHLAPLKAAPPSSRVPAGRRAITIPVDDINSLSGMLQAGDLLIFTFRSNMAARQITAPLLQGVLVLATGREGGGEEAATGAFSTITLDAGPEDAVKLVAARQAGRITAILRHHHDAGTNATAARGDLAAAAGHRRRGRKAPAHGARAVWDRPAGDTADTHGADDERRADSGLFDADVRGRSGQRGAVAGGRGIQAGLSWAGTALTRTNSRRPVMGRVGNRVERPFRRRIARRTGGRIERRMGSRIERRMGSGIERHMGSRIERWVGTRRDGG